MRRASMLLLTAALAYVLASVVSSQGEPDMRRIALHDAIYTWWFHPIAVNDGTHAWVGSIGQGTSGVADRLNRLWRVDHVTGEADSVRLDGLSGPGDHRTTVVAVNPDRDQVIAFYTRHNNDSHVRMQHVDRETMQAGPLVELEFSDVNDITYAQVLQHGDTIHLLTRRLQSEQWVYRTSTDWGQSWGPVKVFLDFSGHVDNYSAYVAAKPDPTNPTVVHVGVAPHPPNSDDAPETRYATINLTTGEVSSTSGSSLGNLNDPAGPELVRGDLEVVVSPTSGDRTRLLDVGVVDGRPALAYATWTGEEGDPTYRVRRHDGSSWGDVAWSLPSGPEFGYIPDRRYVGGLAFGPEGELWSSRKDGDWIVERWQWHGTDFGFVEELDRSATRLIRPYVPLGSGNGVVLYQRVPVYSETNTTSYESDVLLVGHPAEPGAPPPAPSPGVALSPASIRPQVVWVAVDAVTGHIIGELPDVTGTISRALGTYTSTSLTIPIPTVGPKTATLAQRATAAVQATQPRRTIIVAIVNDVPAWAGLIVACRGGTGPSLDVGTVTPEGYLARRRVRDHQFVQTEQVDIMSALAKDAEAIGGQGQGLGLVHDLTPSGILRDQPYVASDRTPVLQRMQELSRRRSGPEWTIDIEWADADQTAIVKVLRVAGRIGITSEAIFETAAGSVFDSRGAADATYTLDEDYSDGRGANWIVAYSSGEGDDQPASTPAIDGDDLAAGSPIFERHWQPSSSITSQQVLDEHAQAELERLRRGATTWQIAARWDAYPRYGVDWRLGDDVSWHLTGHRHPDGVFGTGRVIGWELDLQAGLIRPQLLDPTEGDG